MPEKAEYKEVTETKGSARRNSRLKKMARKKLERKNRKVESRTGSCKRKQSEEKEKEGTKEDGRKMEQKYARRSEEDASSRARDGNNSRRAGCVTLVFQE